MGIVFTALWLLTPMLGEKSVGSTAIDTAKPKVEESVEQSLASDAGDGINLSMEGTGHKRKEDGVLGSSLYQPAPEDAAATAAATAGSAALGSSAGSASGGTLAGALKKVSESSGGWGDKKAQRGFNLPKLAGGSLSGMGAASGGRAGSASGSSAFGSSNANIGFAGTKGLSGSADLESGPASKSMAALKAASAQAQAAAGKKSLDDSRGSMSGVFDGAKSGSKIGGGPSAMGAAYAALDAAPANLKEADPKLNEKKIEPPPGADVAQSDMGDSELAKQIAMQMAGAVLGAVIGGPVGPIITQVIMQAAQRQADQEAKIREMQDKQNLDRAAQNQGN